MRTKIEHASVVRLVLFCMVTTGTLARCGGEPPSLPPRPDVVLIVVDTLRADHLGCYGYALDTSPNIDGFAASGLLFENGLSHAVDTRYAMASLLSGYLPHETGVLAAPELEQELEMLAEILGEQGYATAAVISNYVLKRGLGYSQGFDVYDDTMEQAEALRKSPERTAAPTTDRAIELLEQDRVGPLFLWVHYQDPHGPYAPPSGVSEPFRDRDAAPRPIRPSGSLGGRGGIPVYQQFPGESDFDFYRSRYDGEIRHVDNEIQRLFEALDEETLVVFTSDHGEGMGEHDYYFAHGEYLYQHQLHVPLILRWGDRLRGRRADFVGHVDILPTILGVLGITAPPGLRGTDLRVEGQERALVSEMRSPLVPDGRQLSYVQDGIKLIFTPPEDYELYDLRSDPHELRDLSGDPAYRDRADGLGRRLAAAHNEDRLGLEPASGARELSEEQREKLRSLGYVE